MPQPALADIPVVVFTGKELTRPEQERLKTMAKSIVLKDVQSPERLLDETALFLHRVVTDLPAAKQTMLAASARRQRSACAAARCWSSTMTRATSLR